MVKIGEIKYHEEGIKLDKKDRKILSLLMLDARINLSELAKYVGLSKSNISRRISKLENEGLIKGYHAFINTARIGFKSLLVLIKTQTISKNKEKYIEGLIKNKNIYGITEHIGVFDLIVGINYRTEEEKEKVLEEILNKNIIKDFEIFRIKTYFPKFDYTHEMVSQYNPKISIDQKQKINIDEKDIKILASLSKNCRTPIVKLVKELNIQRETITYRIKKLVSSGVIAKFQPNVDYFMLGSEFYFVMLKLIKPTQKSKVIDYIAGTLRANTIIETEGSFQVMAFVQFKSNNEFRRFEEDLFKYFPDTIFDYAFEIAKAQYKLDWFPENLINPF